MNFKLNIYIFSSAILIILFTAIRYNQSDIVMNKVMRLFRVDYEVFGRVQGYLTTLHIINVLRNHGNY